MRRDSASVILELMLQLMDFQIVAQAIEITIKVRFSRLTPEQ
jgi:hypothetical protein